MLPTRAIVIAKRQKPCHNLITMLIILSKKISSNILKNFYSQFLLTHKYHFLSISHRRLGSKGEYKRCFESSMASGPKFCALNRNRPVVLYLLLQVQKNVGVPSGKSIKDRPFLLSQCSTIRAWDCWKLRGCFFGGRSRGIHAGKIDRQPKLTEKECCGRVFAQLTSSGLMNHSSTSSAYRRQHFTHPRTLMSYAARIITYILYIKSSPHSGRMFNFASVYQC